MNSNGIAPVLLSVDCIWKGAKHNAFTDLIYFQGSYFCCFRESDTHAGGKLGKIRLLTSIDAKIWKPAALLSQKDVDLRDPMLSITPDGRLMLNMGGIVYFKNKIFTFSSFVAFSSDGLNWSAVIALSLEREWIWRLTWHKGVGYGTSYRAADPKNPRKSWELTLFSTVDGLHYTTIKQLEVPHWPSEGTLRFTSDDTMIALIRRRGGGYIGSARPPYTDWQFFESAYHLGGPNFLILPDGKMWACSRLHKKKGRKNLAVTALFRMSLNALEPVIEFPSGGDTSYPGMVYHNNQLLVTYYSSHQEKTKIYLANIKLS